MKKIIIVIGSFKLGGAEKMALLTGESLRYNGYEVYYFLQRNKIELDLNIDEKFIYVANKRQLKIKIFNHLISTIKLIFYSWKLNPKWVIGFTYYSSFISIFTFRKVIARFDANPFAINRKLRHNFAKASMYCPWVKYIVVPSRGFKDFLEKKFPYLKKVHTIYNFIDPEIIIQKSSENSKIDLPFQNFIVSVGRLMQKKRFDLLLESFKKIDNKDIGLVIIGDGPEKFNLIEQVNSSELKGRVILLGKLNNPYYLMKKALLLVNTSISESFCNVVLESLILKTPVICFDCEFGPNEIIENRQNGVLVPINEIEKLTEEINSFLKDQLILDAEENEYLIEKFSSKNSFNYWEKLIN